MCVCVSECSSCAGFQYRVIIVLCALKVAALAVTGLNITCSGVFSSPEKASVLSIMHFTIGVNVFAMCTFIIQVLSVEESQHVHCRHAV